MATLEITTLLGCSLNCTFCPQDKLRENYRKDTAKILSFENFTKILNKIPNHVRIDFSGMTEPFLNPEAIEMVKYCYAKKRNVTIYTTLVGIKTDEADFLLNNYRTKISSVNPWVIHLPDNSNNMRGWKNTLIYRSVLKKFVDDKVKYKNSALMFMTMDKNGIIHSEIADIFPEKLDNFFGISRVENLNRINFDKEILEEKIEIDCPVGCKSTVFFDHNVLMPNGDIVLCCMDYAQKNIIGNIYDQEYYEIFQGQEMTNIRTKAMQPYFDKDFICKSCSNAVIFKKNGKVNEWVQTNESYGASPKKF
jgi:radical SAM protein with 4Fe4S-binding SPASM domain